MQIIIISWKQNRPHPHLIVNKSSLKRWIITQNYFTAMNGELYLYFIWYIYIYLRVGLHEGFSLLPILCCDNVVVFLWIGLFSFCIVYFNFLSIFNEADWWVNACMYCSSDDGDNISPKHVNPLSPR